MVNIKEAEREVLSQFEDKGIIVHFFEDEWTNPETHEREIRTYVRKIKEKNNIYISFARGEDISQHPREYEIFYTKKKRRDAGTRLRKLGLSNEEIIELEANDLYTVEELSRADDLLIRSKGLSRYRDAAQDFIDGVDEKDKEIAKLKAELEKVKNDSSNNGPKRRGRKPAVRETGNSSEQLQQGDSASS